MLSVAVHKDIGEYQPKVVGKMTGRTLASIAGAHLGSSFMAKRVKSLTLTRIFALALVLLALQRVVALVG